MGRLQELLSELKNGQIIQENPNMLLTLAWSHRTPTNTPTIWCIKTRVSISLIGTEHEVDNIACAYYVVGQAVAAGLLHQGCPVDAIRDCQVVIVTFVMVINFKISEAYRQDVFLIHFYRFSPVNKVARIVAREEW